MLDNTNIVLGSTGAELSKLLTRYNQLALKIKDLETTKKEIVQQVLEICNRKAGKYESNKYVFNVSYCEGKVSVSNKELKEKYPTVFEELATQGNGYFQLKNITRKQPQKRAK